MKTYWISEDQTTGWTIQGFSMDLPVEISGEGEQRAAISNIALNAAILDSGVLRRPTAREPSPSFSFAYPAEIAAQWADTQLPDLGSLSRAISYLVTNQLYVMRTDPLLAHLALGGTLYLMSTEDGTTEVEQAWSA